MNIYNIELLIKLKRRNKGNPSLTSAITKLISDLENNNFMTPNELLKVRPDADHVFGGMAYFFNMKIHRTLIIIKFDHNDAFIAWCGSHDEYELTFKNNKSVIVKWLRNNDFI